MYVGVHGRERPDKPAVISVGEDGETVLTYRELDMRSTRLAHVLRGAGLVAGDVIAVMTANHPAVSEAYWAAQRSGLYYVPVNVRLSAAEIDYVLSNSGARVVIAAPRYAQLAGAAAGVELVLVAGTEAFETALAAAPDGPLPDEREGLPMIYSSGTTGRPKGVKRPRSHRRPGETMFGHDPSLAGAWGLTVDSVTQIPMPVYHSSGMTRLMIAQSLGATTVVMERFEPARTLAAIERHRVTHTLWVATMLIRLLQLPEHERLRYDLSSQVGATVGSGPCPDHVKERIIDWWGPILVEIYGGTEGNGMTRITSAEWLEHRGSVGKPVFGEIHILGEDGQELPVGETGTIYFSGGREFSYHGDPEKTAGVFTPEGWSTLGDVGHLDADGYLFLTDRKADVIIVGGINVYPAEVESVLIAHPAVRDVGVIGVPDEVYGETVMAVVEPMDPDATDALADELGSFCRERLAGFKVPAAFDFTDELPRQPTGKLYKRLLRERYTVYSASTRTEGETA
jgi:long-chain acyl-CoA synthetase